MDEKQIADVAYLPSASRYVQNAGEAERDELPVRRELGRGACAHRRSFVNVSARVVSCRDCEVVLDPIAVLDALAGDREFLVSQRRWLAGSVEQLGRSVDELKREERNAKARIRRARSRREEEAALEAAASAGVKVDGYRSWQTLNGDQRKVVVGRVRRIVEAYHGALADAGRLVEGAA